jgi:hypothetical protein
VSKGFVTRLQERYVDPEQRAILIHFFWITSLGMLALGYAIIAYLLLQG